MQLSSKCAVFQILLDKSYLYFYVPFPLFFIHLFIYFYFFYLFLFGFSMKPLQHEDEFGG